MPVRRSRNSDSGFSNIPGDGDRLQELCTDTGFTNEQAVAPFLEKIRKIFTCGRQHGVSEGEVVLMVSYSMGYVGMRDVPFGKMDAVIGLITSYQGDERYRVFDPEMYVALKAERVAVAQEAARAGVDEKTISINKAFKAMETIGRRSCDTEIVPF
jgi:hypothetical protein